MKIIFLSDTHNRHAALKLPPCDMIIHTGDATGTGKHSEVVNFAKWFEKQDATHKIFIPGNHEKQFESQLPISKAWFTDHCSGRLLIHEYVELGGLKIFGSPYTPLFFNWAFMKKRGDEIKKYWDAIPEGLDILACHGMPYQILDTAEDWETGKMVNVGCVDLRARIGQVKPKIFVGGHLHTGGGHMITVGETAFYNAAICDENYRPENLIHIIEL